MSNLLSIISVFIVSVLALKAASYGSAICIPLGLLWLYLGHSLIDRFIDKEE